MIAVSRGAPTELRRGRGLFAGPVLLLATALAAGPASADEAPDAAPADAQLRAWVERWKTAPRGPFEGIRWFCADGSVQPPQPYACRERGGGRQHGLLEPRVATLRAAGFPVANLLAEVEPNRFVGASPDLEALRALLVERFLIGWDDGWVFRVARSYRGALQIEDEEEGARRLLRALLSDPGWHAPPRFFLLRETMRLLPLQEDAPTAGRVRAWTAQLAERDPSFAALRTRIHNAPSPADAGRVRTHARGVRDAALRAEYEELASTIDAQFARRDAARDAEAAADALPDPAAAAALRSAARAVREAGEDHERRLAALGNLLVALRDELPGAAHPEATGAVLAASLGAEEAWFATGQELREAMPGWSRRRQLVVVDAGVRAAYGAGLLARRHWSGVQTSLRTLEAPDLELARYRDELGYLARAPEWAGRWIEFHFGRAVALLARIEPLAVLFGQDRLRGSPLLLLGSVLDRLLLDANALAGTSHALFGSPASGLRALNPGIARGRLVAAAPGEELALPRDAIALLPETTAELGPVAGILTLGEGSSLSHVQLLARNLGVPNAVVRGAALDAVRARLGERAVLAVSPGGTVRVLADGPELDRLFPARAAAPDAGIRIEPDLEKLDLAPTAPIPLSALRSADSGRVAGPKGANLGELRRFHPEAVPDGFVLPFGAFRALLERPLEPGGPSAFAWMRARYAEIRAESDAAARGALERALLARLRAWITGTELPPELATALRAALAQQFGEDGSYGVFVRSDTNVEDLPGFTGAGLNLTVPNVVGTGAILRAIRDVWASPFSERAYAWRQAHMDRPEYVFPAVVVQRAFASEKSGVLVTVDVDIGDPRWLSIAVNEGVGGAVEGQAAESLRVPVEGGRVRYLAQATAPERSVLDPAGGVRREPASGTDAVLDREEVLKLVEFARDVGRFPALERPGEPPLPADVEFAFRGGELALLQIRPFVESPRARRSQALAEMDAPLRARGGLPVDLDAAPAPQVEP